MPVKIRGKLHHFKYFKYYLLIHNLRKRRSCTSLDERKTSIYEKIFTATHLQPLLSKKQILYSILENSVYQLSYSEITFEVGVSESISYKDKKILFFPVLEYLDSAKNSKYGEVIVLKDIILLYLRDIFARRKAKYETRPYQSC